MRNKIVVFLAFFLSINLLNANVIFTKVLVSNKGDFSAVYKYFRNNHNLNILNLNNQVAFKIYFKDQEELQIIEVQNSLEINYDDILLYCPTGTILGLVMDSEDSLFYYIKIKNGIYKIQKKHSFFNVVFLKDFLKDFYIESQNKKIYTKFNKFNKYNDIPENTVFKVVSIKGDWVFVENDKYEDPFYLRGWIKWKSRNKLLIKFKCF